jgi:hypothetical protein
MGQILTFEEIKNSVEVQTHLKHADHAFAHALYSAATDEQVLKDLGGIVKENKNSQKLLQLWLLEIKRICVVKELELNICFIWIDMEEFF